MMEDSQVPPSFPPESTKVIAESIGIASIGDDVAKEIADEATFRLRLLVQVCVQECYLSLSLSLVNVQ